MNEEVTIRISTGQERAAVSVAPPTPMPLEQIQAGVAAVPGAAETAMLPVPSATPEAVEGLPMPAPMEQLASAAAGEGPLPMPTEQIPETMVELPVPAPLEELEALASAPSPEEEGGQSRGKGRRTKK